MTKTLKTLISQAWPVLISQLAVTFYGIVDTILCGRLSESELAIVGISSNVFGTVFIGFSTILIILLPILSQHHGAGDRDGFAKSTIQGGWLALLLSLPIVLLLLHPGPILSISGLDSARGNSIVSYLAIVSTSVPALLLFRVYFAYSASTLRPKNVMRLNFVGLLLKAPLSYFLVYGIGEFPGFGAYGCAISTAAVSWIVFVFAIISIYNDPLLPSDRLMKCLKGPDFKILLEFLKGGFPIGLTFFIDYTSLTVIGLLVARFGVITTGAHQIASSVSLLAYLIPMSMGSAASVLVARAIGSGLVTDAEIIGRTSIRTAILSGLIIGIVLNAFSAFISSIGTNSSLISVQASSLIACVGIYHAFDSIVTVTSGVLRGYKKTFVPTVIFGITLWAVGLGGGSYLAFRFNGGMGAKGFWVGLATAALFATISMLIYFQRVTRKESDKLGRTCLSPTIP